MEIQEGTLNSRLTIISPEKIDEEGNDVTSEDETTDMFSDSIAGETLPDGQLDQNITYSISAMGVVYPNDKINLQKIIDLFLRSYNKVSGNNLKNSIDLHIEFNPEEEIENNTSDEFNNLLTSLNMMQRNTWINNWVQQLNVMQNDAESSAPADREAEEYYFYSETDEQELNS